MQKIDDAELRWKCFRSHVESVIQESADRPSPYSHNRAMVLADLLRLMSELDGRPIASHIAPLMNG